MISSLGSVAVAQWAPHDGIADAITKELTFLGVRSQCFMYNSTVPSKTEIVLTFAPYGPFLPIAAQFQDKSLAAQVKLIHWNLESLPDPRIPWTVLAGVSQLRSWIGRTNSSTSHGIYKRANLPWELMDRRMHKFRYVGDYIFSYREGWLTALADASEINARRFSRHGIPAVFVPWGTPSGWYADLHTERDIDVLWMSKRRNPRRSKLLDQIRAKLEPRGVRFHVSDGVEHPFIYGEERTRYLNRAKITLNLLPTWYDTNFPFRYHPAAANRSLVISEPFLPHTRLYKSGTHYVSAPAGTMADTILHYLAHDGERMQIIDHAYHLVTRELTLHKSVECLMGLAITQHLA